MPPGSRLDVVPFSEAAFFNAVRAAQGAPPDPTPHHVDQVRYLGGYLAAQEVSAKTMVIEDGYFDRHFMDEHASYHATRFCSPANYCTRIHFFSLPFTASDLDSLLCDPDDSSPKFKQVADSYVGFTCIRPLAEAPIGRTILRPYPRSVAKTNHERIVGGVSQNTVHLGSLRLAVEGLPFQQQDGRVGACATTATWSALACVSRADGDRPPTPSEVTDAAVQFLVSVGRPYPSSGLEIEQICQAIHTLGKAPDLISAEAFPVRSIQMLPSFVRSGVPVIMALAPVQRVAVGVVHVPGQEGHAVTCVGYRKDPNLPMTQTVSGFNLPALQFRQIYVHDDNLGPYARAQLNIESLVVEVPSVAPNVQPTYLPLGDRCTVTIKGRSWMLTHLLAPLYPKVRTSVVELYKVGSQWIDAIVDFTKEKASRFSVDCVMTKGGTLLADLRRSRAPLPSAAGKAAFMKAVSLSRYVGVVELGLDGKPWLKLIWDTTDRVSHDPQKLTGLLGMIVLDPGLPAVQASVALRKIPIAV